jgi:peptide/nickel transport system substrate-binding protein
MQFYGTVRPRFSQILGLGLMLVALLAMACGTSAPATIAPPEAAPTAIPQAVAQPTAAPEVMAQEVHPGTVTWMVGGWGNERFDRVLGAGPGFMYARLLHGFLISTNEDSELIGGIAESWDITPDGLVINFNIRDGIKFHDGSDLTAEDVIWTLRHYFSPEAADYALSDKAQAYGRIFGPLEQNGNQITMNFKQFVAGFLTDEMSEAGTTWWGILPERDQIYDKQVALDYDKNPVGAGPMSFVKHTASELIALERFDDFYFQPAFGGYEDRRPNFTTLELRLVPEEATRVAAIRAGSADIVPASLPAKKQIEAGGGRLIFAPEGTYFRPLVIGCWNTQYPCHDIKVRQALAYALDKELMRDQLFGGPEAMEVKGWAAVTPSTIGYSAAVDPLPYEPDRARQLLADAGYPDGEGFGELIVNTWQSDATPFLPESAQFAADSWKRELGLDTMVRVGDSSTLNKSHRAGDLDGQILWRDNEARIDGSEIIWSLHGNPEQSRRLHEREDLTEFVTTGLQELDPAKQEQSYNEVYQRLRDESYIIGVGYLNIPWGLGPRILTWEPYPLAIWPSAIHTITLK